jgi:hypothetical protein
LKIISDGNWLSSQNETAGWDSPNFDDSNWSKAMVVGKYGDAPWGAIGPAINNPIYGPQSTGINGVVRVIYVPENDPVILHDLPSGTRLSAVCFDPVTGSKTAPVTIQADTSGSVSFPSPVGNDHDWVLILELPGK